MDKVWLQNYPAGVPAHADVTAFASVVEVFDHSIARFADKVAFINQGVTLTYAEVGALADRFASWLQRDAGIVPGARVAIMLPNLLQYPVALLGVLRAGGVVVNLNPQYTSRELEHPLRDAEPDVVLVLENFAATLQAVLPKLERAPRVVVTSVGDMLGLFKGMLVDFVVRHVKRMVPAWRIDGALRWRDVTAASLPAPRAVPLGLGDIAFLQYTGGTSGVPKGAVLTHGNIVANLQQAHAWIGPWVKDGEELIVTALPLYHIFSLTANLLTFFKIGARNLLITNPRDIDGMVRVLAQHRFTAITGVNTLFNALLNHPRFAQLDFSALKISLGGGAAVQQAVAERWRKLTGQTLVEAFGMTETSPAVAINPLDLTAYNGAVGLPLPDTEISLRDDEGREVALGEPGELCIRGPQVMREYWRRPDETRRAFTDDGYFRSGDMAVFDEQGYLRIVDRKKDMVLVSGFNVFPNEVEDVLAQHPGVLEAAVVGVKDASGNERVLAYVVRRDETLDAATLRAHCRANLAAYKVPAQIEFRAELPKSNIGKILRRALRDEAEAGSPIE